MKLRAGTSIVAIAVGLVVGGRAARAEDIGAEKPAGCDIPCRVQRVRDMLARGEYEQARDELTTAYQLAPQPALLFALGQVELQLGHFDAAIEFYERFIATNPGDDQVSLAQQAIGAARMRRAQRPVHRGRRWDVEDTGLVAIGGVAAVAGAAAIAYGAHLTGNHTGTLSAYDARLAQARTARWSGVGLVAAGVVVATAAVVRWRLSGEVSLVAGASPSGAAAMAVEGRW